MNKYEKAQKRMEESYEFEEKQKDLRDKYGINEENVVIKETSNMTKFLISSFSHLLRILAMVSLLILAMIGLTVLLYEPLRTGFFDYVLLLWTESR